MKKVSHKKALESLKALQEDLIAAFCGDLPESEHFTIKRSEPEKVTSLTVKTTDKLDAYKHDIVYVPVLNKIIREACDCARIPFRRTGLALKAGMSVAWIHSQNVKAGTIYYGTYQKLRAALAPYKHLLKYWDQFSNVRLIERGSFKYRKVVYKNLNNFALSRYNAGSRKVKLAHIDNGDVITFFDKTVDGVFMRRANIPDAEVDVTMHTLGAGITVEPTPPLKAELMACVEDSLTHRGMRYSVADKEELV